MALHNNCIRSAEDLITTREQTRAGFVEAALEKIGRLNHTLRKQKLSRVMHLEQKNLWIFWRCMKFVKDCLQLRDYLISL